MPLKHKNTTTLPILSINLCTAQTNTGKRSIDIMKIDQ